MLFTATKLRKPVAIRYPRGCGFNVKQQKLQLLDVGRCELIEEGNMPDGINQLRLGESILLGRETAYGHQIKGTHSDCFKLIAEIIEVKNKPSSPIGEVKLDAFGKKPSFVDTGVRKRALCAVGKQDVAVEDIVPEDEGLILLGASSDHLILDVTDCDRSYKVGDLIPFYLKYGGILRTMSSEYVARYFKQI